MRKFFSFIAAVLFAGSMMATTYSMTPDNETTGNTSTTYVTTLTEFTHAGISWKMNQWNPNTLQVKTNQGSAASEFRFYNTSAFSGKITKVVVTFSALTLKSTSETGFMFVGGSEEVSATSGGVSGVWDADAKTLTWEPAATDNFTYFALYQNGKVATGTNKLATEDAIVVTYEGGAAPAVEAPSIKGDTHFYDESEVTITCATDGATIYYTNNGTDPDANSYRYMGSFYVSSTMTIKAIAIKGEDVSAISEKVFTKNPSFDSFEALIAAELPTNTQVEVSFENIVIDSIYTNRNNVRQGIYFAINGTKYEIYYNKTAVPAQWVPGGKLSGVNVRGNWTYFTAGALWELVPSAEDWGWNLNYSAPAEVVSDGYYLVGNFNGVDKWSIEALSEDVKFVANTSLEARAGEMVLYDVTLTVGDEFKVALVENGVIPSDAAHWFGSGEGNANFVVTEAYAGQKDIYFVPTWQDDWNGHIWVADHSATAIDNTDADAKAVKFFENGQLIIIKNGVKYNAQGAIVK